MAKKSSTLKPGSKIEKLYSWLKREIVGTEILFTSSHAQQLTTELNVRLPEFVWNMLQHLEQRGLISRTRRENTKGIVVSFPTTELVSESQEPTQKRGRRRSRSKRSVKRSKRMREVETSQSLDELISGLGIEIEDLKKTFDARVKLHDKLVTARAELKRR